MDLKKLTLFRMMSDRMDWLTQRQQVLSQNVANADTPQYGARDLKPIDFKGSVRSGRGISADVSIRPGGS